MKKSKKQNIKESTQSSNSPGTRGYTGFLPSELWNSYKKELNNSIKNSTGYSIVGLDDIPTDTIKVNDNPINKTDVTDKNISERIKLKDILLEKREYYIDPSKKDTRRYIIKDGNAYYVGMVGVKSGNTYIKFTHKGSGGIWLKGLKKLSNEKALEKEMKKDKHMPKIDFKKLYKR